MRYFSMFSGIGGFELGFPSNWQCVGFSEIDKYATQVYLRHFNNHKNYGDATAINPIKLPDFDLLCGGFPCQAFSVAGKRKGFNDTRGTLFFDIARIVAHKRPRYLLLENVKGLLTHDSGKTFQTILRVLTDLGYRVQWQLLNSKDFGVPQNRERVYIIGHTGTVRRPEIFPLTTGGKTINSRNEQRAYKTSDTITARYGTKNGRGTNIAIPVLTPDRHVKRQNGRRFKTNGEVMFTLNTQDRHGVYDGCNIRRLTPLECERLQGFPDNWTNGISDSQRYKCLGNAVTVNVIRAIVQAWER